MKSRFQNVVIYAFFQIRGVIGFSLTKALYQFDDPNSYAEEIKKNTKYFQAVYALVFPQTLVILSLKSKCYISFDHNEESILTYY